MTPQVLASVTEPLRATLDRLGLQLSEEELLALADGDRVSLARRDLSEIGSLFILAAAISPFSTGKPRRKIAFADLPQDGLSPAAGPGLPLSCWQDESGKYCLYLTIAASCPSLVRVALPA